MFINSIKATPFNHRSSSINNNLKNFVVKSEIEIAIKPTSVDQVDIMSTPQQNTQDSLAHESLLRQLESSRQATKILKEEMEGLLKCIILAQRIINGDKIPISDHQFLREKAADMYHQALMLSTTNKDSKEYESILEEESEEEAVSADTSEDSTTTQESSFVEVSEVVEASTEHS